MCKTTICFKCLYLLNILPRFNVDCSMASIHYSKNEGLFAGTGGSGGGHPIGGDECPALDQLGEQDCQGAVSSLSWLPPDSPQVSTCWSPGQPDGDCPNFGLCCFDGCADTCGEGESSPSYSLLSSVFLLQSKRPASPRPGHRQPPLRGTAMKSQR